MISAHSSTIKIKARVRGHRGGAMINAIVFAAIISLIMAGIARVSVSHYSRAMVEANYVAALYQAEAGINFELQKITAASANADQKSVNSPYGPTYTLGSGSFKVYCMNTNGTTPWTTGSSSVVIVSRGVCNGVTRQVSTTANFPGTSTPRLPGSIPPGSVPPGDTPSGSTPAQPTPTSGTGGNYVLYGADITKSSTIAGSPNLATGDIGVNHLLDINGNPAIPGTIYFNGPNAGDSGGGGCHGPTYTTKTNASAVTWATVDSIANTTFPSGGLTWLSTHNDNSLASIASNTVTLTGNSSKTFVGKAGGANYYLTSISCAGNSTITFNNTNGPINIWFGPLRGSGTISMRGGNCSVAMSSDATKGVRMYNAKNSPFIITGNSTLEAGIYCVTGGCSNNAMQFQGNGTFIGSAIGDSFTCQGNPTMNFRGGYFTTTGSTYKANNAWYDSYKVNQ